MALIVILIAGNRNVAPYRNEKTRSENGVSVNHNGVSNLYGTVCTVLFNRPSIPGQIVIASPIVWRIRPVVWACTGDIWDLVCHSTNRIPSMCINDKREGQLLPMD